MSWWIKEVISTNRDQTQRLCACECDDMTVTPDPIQYTDDTQTAVDYTIVRGSSLYCISNSKTYKLNTSGQWVEQKTGQEIEIDADSIIYDNTGSGMTATTVQDAIDELESENGIQDNSIAELYGEDANQQLEIDYSINTGVKNLFDINATAVQNHVTSTLTDDTLTVTSNGNWAHYSVPINLPAGGYIFTTTISNFSKDSSAGATSVRIRIATSTSGVTSVVLETVTGNGPMTIPFTSPGGQLYVQFYPNYSSTTTYVNTFTANNVMIRSSVVKSSTYKPYAQTNPELTKEKTTLSDIFGTGNLIPDSTDLDNMISPGTYYGVNSTGQTASNIPTANGAYHIHLIVMQSSSNTYLQIFKRLDSTGDPYFYIRRRSNTGVWGSWYQYGGTVVTQSVQSISPSLNTLNLGNDELNLRSEELDTNFELLEGIDERDDLDDI